MHSEINVKFEIDKTTVRLLILLAALIAIIVIGTHSVSAQEVADTIRMHGSNQSIAGGNGIRPGKSKAIVAEDLTCRKSARVLFQEHAGVARTRPVLVIKFNDLGIAISHYCKCKTAAS